MKKTIKHAVAIALLASFAVLALGSMGSSPSSTSSVNNASNIYSSTTEQGMVYTFYNNSSHTVTIWDSTGSKTIESGGSVQARFNRSTSVYDVRYSPDDRVICEQAGSGFFFKDR